jgi:hypothetical protein
MTEAGQLVSVKSAMDSGVIGVSDRRTGSLSFDGINVIVGRFAPLTFRSGRIEVNVLKMTLLLLGLGATKNGLASAPPPSSYWVAIEETLNDRCGSL